MRVRSRAGSWITVIASGVVVLLAGAGLGLMVWWAPRMAGPAGTSGSGAGAPSDYGSVPEFTLTERSGQPVGLRDLRGLVWVADFMYTQCPDTCPLQSAELARLQAEFVGSADLRLVSITLDPEHDTPAVLGRYARRFGAGDHWFFLTGSRRQTFCLATRGFHLPVSDPRTPPIDCGLALRLGPSPAWAHEGHEPLRILHGPRLTVVDREGRIRAYRQATDPDDRSELRRDLRALLASGARS